MNHHVVTLLAIMSLMTSGCLFGSDPNAQGTDSGSSGADAGGTTDADGQDGQDVDVDAEDDAEPDGLYIFFSFREFEVGGGIDGADELCDIDRNKPNAGKYRALIGSPMRHAGVPDCQQGQPRDWVLNKNQRYINSNGDLVFETNNLAVNFDWPMAHTVSDEGVNFASGIERDWCFAEDLNCGEWTDDEGGEMRVGWAKDDTEGFMSGGKVSCGRKLRLMCVEQPRRQGL